MASPCHANPDWHGGTVSRHSLSLKLDVRTMAQSNAVMSERLCVACSTHRDPHCWPQAAFVCHCVSGHLGTQLLLWFFHSSLYRISLHFPCVNLNRQSQREKRGEERERARKHAAVVSYWSNLPSCFTAASGPTAASPRREHVLLWLSRAERLQITAFCLL